jgi:polyferredoxin
VKTTRPARRGPATRAWLRKLVSARRAVQIATGAAIYLAIARFNLGLGIVLVVGSAVGIVFGKFFCRWLCPMGALMELLLGLTGDEAGRTRSFYNYFKVGCPIAWAGGLPGCSTG